MENRAYTPALGQAGDVRHYDRLIALLTRESVWRSRLVKRLAPAPGEMLVDLGCGTGSLAIRIAQAAPGAKLIGIDPDGDILAIAREKARAAGAPIEFRQAMGDETADIRGADAAVSSLVLHQCPMPMKRALLRQLHGMLRPGGRLVIGDYGLQRTAAMRLGFRLVQWADGKEDTQPNADGVLPQLIAEAGFSEVAELDVVPTVTGSISIYGGLRAS